MLKEVSAFECKDISAAEEESRGESSAQACAISTKDAVDNSEGPGPILIHDESHVLRLLHHWQCIVPVLCNGSFLCRGL